MGAGERWLAYLLYNGQVIRSRTRDKILQAARNAVCCEHGNCRDKRLLPVTGDIERPEDQHRKEQVGGECNPRKEGIQERSVVEPSDEMSECVVVVAEIE